MFRTLPKRQISTIKLTYTHGKINTTSNPAAEEAFPPRWRFKSSESSVSPEAPMLTLAPPPGHTVKKASSDPGDTHA